MTTKRLTLKLEPEIINLINTYCAVYGLKPSEYITKLVKEDLKEYQVADDEYNFTIKLSD